MNTGCSLRAGLSDARGGARRPGYTRDDPLDEEGGLDSASASESESELEDEVPAEYVEPLGGPTQPALPFLPGRLRACLPHWRGFARSKFVLSVLESGYKIEWKGGPPPPCLFSNKPGCFGSNHAFVCEAIGKLRAQGAICPCRRDQLRCVLAMDVNVNSEGKQRLIVDARPVNTYERKRRFKCETMGREGRDVFDGCRFGGSIDISHAYHHIEMAVESRCYLGIEWNGEYFAWQVLPFGLSSAPWVWVMVSREPVRVFRQWCIRVLHYMDDFPHGAGVSSESVSNAQRMIAFLRKCGFVLEPERKCIGHVVALQAFPALGFVVDLQSQEFKTKPGRLLRINALARELYSRRAERVPAKMVAAFVGLVISSSLALGGVTRMRTRALYAVLGSKRTRKEWQGVVWLSPEAVEELLFWSGDLTCFDGMPIKENQRSLQVDVRGASDASAKGYGAWMKIDEGCRPEVARLIRARVAGLCDHKALWASVLRKLSTAVDFRGELTPEQQGRSSTWREAWAVCEFMEFAAPVLEGCRVRLNLDNTGVVFGLGGLVPGFEGKVYGGSRRPDIHALLVRVFNACVKARITLIAVWVPREKNEKADFLSKMTDHYDFSLDAGIFGGLDVLWGPHLVDRFSSAKTVLVRSGRYNARLWQTVSAGCEGIDAFAQEWQGVMNWVHPPYRLIGRTILHMRQCKAWGTVVVPWWEKAVWWPLLRQGEGWAGFVREAKSLGPSVRIVSGRRVQAALRPRGGLAAALDELPVGELWALRVSFAH